jgi:hypothetical protein
MKKNKAPNQPKVGDKIYVESRFYISHGSDDVVGGLATISRVTEEDTTNAFNRWFVEVEELPGRNYNWNYLMEPGRQEKLKKQFGKRKAHPDPDIDTPWIEEGDYVSDGTGKGHIHHGPPIW